MRALRHLARRLATPGSSRRLPGLVCLVSVTLVAAVSCATARDARLETSDASTTSTSAVPELPRGLVYVLGDSNLPSALPGYANWMHARHGRIPYVSIEDTMWGSGFVTGSAPSPQIRTDIIGALRGGVSRSDPDVVLIELGTVDCGPYLSAAFDAATDQYDRVIDTVMASINAADTPSDPLVVWVDVPPLPILDQFAASGVDECRSDHNSRLASAQARWPNLWVLPTDAMFVDAWGSNGTARCASLLPNFSFAPKLMGDADPVTPGVQSECTFSDNLHFNNEASSGLAIAYIRVLMWIFNNNLTPCPLDAVTADLSKVLTEGLTISELASGPGCPSTTP